MRTCAVCGEPIPATRPGHNTKYCSLKCARRAEAQQNIANIMARTTRHNRIAFDVCCAYDSKCALCGWQVSPELITVKGKVQFAHGNEIHHITPLREGGTDEWDNVIMLCPNHHKAADLGLIDRDTLRANTKPYKRSQVERMKDNTCAEAVTAAIFGTE